MLLLLRTVERRAENICEKERQGRATQAEFHASTVYIKLTRMCLTYVLCAEERETEVTRVRNEAKMNNKFKDPEFLTPIIEKYREMRNLWEVKHPQYYIKPVRKATLEKLLAFVQTFIPEATVEILERKIGILKENV
ncbi:hypothetical protein AB205_0029430 [Aquarana catesbeiana]|uniref:MADF domain-containing protein n=1 Tax=Aquarana catesbeiana TaxID=8400 RepID=A0A2G9RKS4_AQUCT|nr:hypothetical protein AB205_0029430 [Aquarana catesbeiana]